MEIDEKEYEKLQSDLKAAQEAMGGITSLQESVSKLEENNKALLAEKADAKKAAQQAIEEAARKGGDVEALEKSWQDKLNAEISARDDQINKYQQTFQDMTAGTAARDMAAELALPGSADVLLPHIKNRLKVEMSDGSPLVRVLDKDGKPSAMSIDELRKEVEANPAFAPILIGSRASGAGDVGKKGESHGSTISRDNFDQLGASDKMKMIKEGTKVID